MNKYNGWTNWDTWNANLWLNNDETIYNVARQCSTASDIRQTFLDAFDDGSNEFDGIDYGKVNWYEILKGLKDA